jgi:hypothetical protein
LVDCMAVLAGGLASFMVISVIAGIFFTYLSAFLHYSRLGRYIWPDYRGLHLLLTPTVFYPQLHTIDQSSTFS